MEYAVSAMAAKGFTLAVLKVLVDNARARRFYERFGFTADGLVEPIMLGKEVLEARYRLPLTPQGKRMNGT